MLYGTLAYCDIWLGLIAPAIHGRQRVVYDCTCCTYCMLCTTWTVHLSTLRWVGARDLFRHYLLGSGRRSLQFVSGKRAMKGAIAIPNVLICSWQISATLSAKQADAEARSICTCSIHFQLACWRPQSCTHSYHTQRIVQIIPFWIFPRCQTLVRTWYLLVVAIPTH